MSLNLPRYEPSYYFIKQSFCKYMNFHEENFQLSRQQRQSADLNVPPEVHPSVSPRGDHSQWSRNVNEISGLPLKLANDVWNVLSTVKRGLSSAEEV